MQKLQLIAEIIEKDILIKCLILLENRSKKLKLKTTEKFQFLLINHNFKYSAVNSLLVGFTMLQPRSPTCSHHEQTYCGPSRKRIMAIQANFGFINVWDGGGVKRLFFLVWQLGVIRNCWNVWTIKSVRARACVCVCVHKYLDNVTYCLLEFKLSFGARIYFLFNTYKHGKVLYVSNHLRCNASSVFPVVFFLIF